MKVPYVHSDNNALVPKRVIFGTIGYRLKDKKR